MTIGQSTLSDQQPWPGLRPFDEGDSAWFFGRQREIDELLSRVERYPVVVLYGQSGLGKTSLLRAGLFPELKQRDRVPVWIRLDYADGAKPPGTQILDNLVATLIRAGVEVTPPIPGETLWSYLHRRDVEFWGARNRLVQPLIVLDQFEELFTLGQRSPQAMAATDALLTELEAQFEQRPPAALRAELDAHPERAATWDFDRQAAGFVLSLREDYLPHLDALRARLPSMLAWRMRLEPMRRDQALDVVRNAGRAVVDEAVAADIVAFVAGQGETVEPAILSVVCDELNLRRQKAGMARITPELLSGERSQIIDDFYERAFDGISDPVRDWVEDELLTASGHRDRAALEDARRAGIDTDALLQLVDRRILHSDERHRVIWLELTHDLLTQPALASRNARQARHAEAEAAAREAASRNALRRSRRLNAVFGLLALVMAAAGVFMYALWARAVEEEARAHRHLNMAEASAITLARQGIEALESAWVNPGLDAATIVEQRLRHFSTLDAQYSATPGMRAWQVQALALAALIHANRDSLTPCNRHAASARDLAASLRADTPENADALALQAYAEARCATLAGALPQAEALQHQAREHLAAMTAARPLRSRVDILTLIGLGEIATMRFDYATARETLARALKTIEAATDLNAVERSGWRVDAWLVTGRAEGVEPDGQLDDEATAWRRALREIAAIPTAQRQRVGWYQRRGTAELLSAQWLQERSRPGEAEAAIQRALDDFHSLLASTPEPALAWQAQHLMARTYQADLAIDKPAARKVFDRLREETGAFDRLGPESISARYLLTWTVATEARQPATTPEAQRRALLAARDRITPLLAQAPAYGSAIRTAALIEMRLGEAMLVEYAGDGFDSGDRPGAEPLERIHAQFDLARQRLTPLAAYSEAADVADIQATIAQHMARVAELAGDREAQKRLLARSADFLRQVAFTPTNHALRAVRIAFPEMVHARLLRLGGDLAAAQAIDDRTENLLKDAMATAPGNVDVVYELIWLYRMASEDLLQAGDIDAAVERIDRATATIQRSLHAAPLRDLILDHVRDIEHFLTWSARTAAVEHEDAGTRDRTGTDTLLARIDGLATLLRKIGAPTAQAPQVALAPGFRSDAWRPVPAEALPEREPRIRPIIDQLAGKGWQLTGARRAPLPFYPDGTWYTELLLRRSDGREGVASVLAAPTGDAIWLNGDTRPLYDFNDQHGLDLRDEYRVLQYFRLFAATVQGEYGYFRIIDDARDLLFEPTARITPRDIEALTGVLKPLHLEPGRDGVWWVSASVQYGNRIHDADLKLPRSGIPVIYAEHIRRRDDALVGEHLVDGVRVRSRVPALQIQVESAVDAQAWQTAADRTRELIAELRAPAGAIKGRAELLVRRYADLGWYELLSGRPAAALAAASEGAGIDPGSLLLKANEMHALVLLGRMDEAEALYHTYVDQPIPGQPGRFWQTTILADLNEMERHGIRHADFARIRRLMAGTQEEQHRAPGP